jgi:CD109 antigen
MNLADPGRGPLVPLRSTVPRPKDRSWAGDLFRVWMSLLTAFLLLWTSVNQKTAEPQEVFLIGAPTWVRGFRGTCRVVVRDAVRQKPVAGAKVQATIGGAKTEAVSGPDGSAEISLPAPEASTGTLRICVDSSAGSDTLERRIAVDRPVRLRLSTDRPLYQPSQTIHVRMLTLDKFAAAPFEGEVAVEIEDPGGNRVFKRMLHSSAFGIAAADFALADEVTLGVYRIRATAGEAVSERAVEVKRYALPKYRIALHPDRRYYAPGSAIRADLEALYTFGSPVADADVQVELAAWAGHQFEPLERLSTRTDDAGRASVAARLPERFLSVEPPYGDARIRLEASVTDGAGHVERKTVESIVTTSSLRLRAAPEGGTYVEGIRGNLHVAAFRPDGSPASATVRINGLDEEFKTDEAGQLVLPLRTGSVSVSAHDELGHRAEFHSNFYKSGPDFLLRTDRNAYRAGETMRLTLLSAAPGLIYLDLVKSGQTVLTRSVSVSEGQASLSMRLPPDLFGALQVSAYRIGRDGSPLRRSRPILVERSDDLRIRARLKKESVRPGEEIEMDFEVLDGSGKPVAAALGLSVVDEAVFAIQDSYPGLEKAHFQIDEALLDSRGPLDSSTGFLEPSFAVARADAMSPDASLLGASLRPAKEGEVWRATRRFNDVAVVVFGGAMVFSFILLLSWLGSKGQTGLVACGFLVGIVALLVWIAIPGMLSSQRASNERSRRPEEVPAPHVDVAVAKDAQAPARLRELFPETLYWNPQLITDERGRVSVAIPGADSITSWRMAINGVTRNGVLGSNEQPIRVFQAFFIDVDVPLTLTEGDEIRLPISIHNHLQEPQALELSLEAESGLEILEGGTRKIQVAAGGVTSVRVGVRARRFGHASLRIHAIGNRFSDSVRRPIEILPDGQEISVQGSDRLTRTSETTVAIPSNAVQGASRLWVRVFPSTFSEIVTGLEGLVRMPHGCFEQTSSVTYPNALVLGYLKATGQLTPEWRLKLDAALEAGYQRLLTFEVRGGGFDWYGAGPAKTLLSAYGVLELNDIDRVHPIDRRVIDRARNLLYRRQNPDGSWDLDVPMHSWIQQGGGRLPTTAYIVWALKDSGTADEPVRRAMDWLRQHATAAKDPYVQALLALALGDRGTLEKLEGMIQGADEFLASSSEGLFHSRGASASIEATALAALALAREGRSPLIDRALKTIARSKDWSGSWHSTQATILCIKALVEGMKAPPKSDRTLRVRISVNDHEIAGAFHPISSETRDLVQQVEIPALAGENRIRISLDGEARASYQVFGRYVLPWGKPAGPAESALALDVGYDRSELRMTDKLKAAVTLRYDGPGTSIVIADLGIPPGFVPDPDSFEALRTRGVVDKYTLDGRRIFLYFNRLEQGKTQSFEYTLSPRFAIRAQIRPSVAYEYYSPQNSASTRPQLLRVTED